MTVINTIVSASRSAHTNFFPKQEIDFGAGERQLSWARWARRIIRTVEWTRHVIILTDKEFPKFSSSNFIEKSTF